MLAKAVCKSNANAAKFQLVFADELCVPSYPYYDFFKSLEMPFKVWESISDYLKKNNLELFFDIYGTKSLKWAKRLEANGVKISTTDFENIDLIQKSLKLFDEVLISIGGVDFKNISGLWNLIEDNRDKVTFMHGFQAEPTLIKDNNLFRLNKLKEKFKDINLGFMDHSEGDKDLALYLPILSLGFGINCLEKHISLDYLLEVEDFVSALSPSKFKKMVDIIRSLEPAMGSSNIKPTKKENDYKLKAGKVLVASRNLKINTIIKERDIALKRVTTKPDPKLIYKYKSILNKRLSTNLLKNEPFTTRILI